MRIEFKIIAEGQSKGQIARSKTKLSRLQASRKYCKLEETYFGNRKTDKETKIKRRYYYESSIKI